MQNKDIYLPDFLQRCHLGFKDLLFSIDCHVEVPVFEGDEKGVEWKRSRELRDGMESWII